MFFSCALCLCASLTLATRPVLKITHNTTNSRTQSFQSGQAGDLFYPSGLRHRGPDQDLYCGEAQCRRSAKQAQERHRRQKGIAWTLMHCF